jgi:hypothetical protein
MGYLGSQIDFSGKKLVIIGNNKVLDAGEAGRFFYGSGIGSSLEVRNVVMRKGKESAEGKYGGAIYISDGTLVIHDSTFDTNFAMAKAARGGAIYAYGADVKIYTSIFESNSATTTFGGTIYERLFYSIYGFGGAIYVEEGTLVIHDSTFDTNAAYASGYGYGGAIAALSGANVEIHDTIFQSNLVEELFMLRKHDWRSTTPHSRAIPPLIAGTAELFMPCRHLLAWVLFIPLMAKVPTWRSTLVLLRATSFPLSTIGERGNRAIFQHRFLFIFEAGLFIPMVAMWRSTTPDSSRIAPPDLVMMRM